jgi:hypothetical protein
MAKAFAGVSGMNRKTLHGDASFTQHYTLSFVHGIKAFSSRK